MSETIFRVPSGEEALKSKLISALKSCYDPEIPVDIYELGLIYEVNVDKEYKAEVIMTLTSPNCPVAGTLPGEVEEKIKTVDGIKDAYVELVFEPTWTQEMMSEEAQLELGML